MKKRVLICIVAILLTLSLLTPAASGSNLAVERQIFAFVTGELGLNSAAACGILANIEAESNFNLTCVGDSGTSFGLCQWHNSRYDNLKSFCLMRGYDYRTLEGQLNFMAYELRTTYQGVFSSMRNVPDTSDGAYSAAYNWCYYYERPADLEGASVRRGRNAQFKYWLRYGGTTGSGTDAGSWLPSNGYSGSLYDGWEEHSFYWDDEEPEEAPAGTTIQVPANQNSGNGSVATSPETGGSSGESTGSHIYYTPHHLPNAVQSPQTDGSLSPWSCLFFTAGPIRKEELFFGLRGEALPEDWDGTVEADEEEPAQELAHGA